MKLFKIKAKVITYVFTLFLCGLIVSGSSFADDVDFMGVPRPQGGAVDFGAFEFIAGSVLIIRNPPHNFGANKTNYQAYQATGVGQTGSAVEIYAGDTMIGTAVVQSNNTWASSLDFSNVEEGAVSLKAQMGSISSNPISGYLTKTYNVNAPRNLRVSSSSSSP